jgi:pyruvate,orthophosphate dikinase
VRADELSVVAAAAGIVTRLGGRASHAGVLARQLGKVCLVGCSDLRIAEDARECMLGRRRLREGEVITIDGESGCIYAGAVGVTTDDRADVHAIVQQWRQAQAEAIGASFPPMSGDTRR